MRWLKIGSLVVLSLATYLVTSGLISRARAQRPAAAATTAGLPAERPVIVDMPGPRPPTGQGETVMMSMRQMQPMTIQVNGHQVHVGAKLEIFHRRPSYQLGWVLRVRTSAQDRIVRWEHRYEDQVFAPTAEQGFRNTYTFDDTVVVPLPAGDYQIELCCDTIDAAGNWFPWIDSMEGPITLVD